MQYSYQKRTATAFLLQGILYFGGICFFDANTILPVFIQAVTGSMMLAGAASSVKQVSTLLFQILMGTYITKVKNLPKYISRLMLLGFSAPLLVALALVLGLSGMKLGVFTLLALAYMWCCDGFCVIGYYNLLGRTLPGSVRGQVLGLQQALGGALALVGAFVVKKILDWPGLALRWQYALLFAIGGIVLLGAACSLSFAKDVPHPPIQETFSLRKELLKIPMVWRKNPNFRRIMLCQIFFNISLMGVPFALLFCRDSLVGLTWQLSTLLNVQVADSLAGGAACMWFSAKFGNRFVVLFYVVVGAVGICAALTSFLSGAHANLLALVLVAASGMSTAAWAGFMNEIIDVAPQREIHTYMLANSICILPVSGVGVVAGKLVQSYGYASLWGTCLAAVLVSMVLAISLYANFGRKDAA